MADITKCTAKYCEWSASCYRKTAPDSVMQSFDDFSARPAGENGWLYWDDVENRWRCKFFIHREKVAV